ncbi:hypothetical protein J2793_006601 [Paraburkholderia caledonica]|uniref:Uncharacterized protein n=1 Tax=Paraburkholderia caledonica TaxID=134536 RepID=A0AB73IM72_9BURK|nr:hypothetical protein [Paraburkholderia caledonica]
MRADAGPCLGLHRFAQGKSRGGPSNREVLGSCLIRRGVKWIERGGWRDFTGPPSRPTGTRVLRAPVLPVPLNKKTRYTLHAREAVSGANPCGSSRCGLLSDVQRPRPCNARALHGRPQRYTGAWRRPQRRMVGSLHLLRCNVNGLRRRSFDRRCLGRVRKCGEKERERNPRPAVGKNTGSR